LEFEPRLLERAPFVDEIELRDVSRVAELLCEIG
jgi:hypothetical protein